MKERNPKKYLVIGVGKFGYGFAQKLIKEGVKESDIYLVDENIEVVSRLSKEFSNTICQKMNDITYLENAFPMKEIDIVLIGSSDFQFSTEIAYSLHVNKTKYKIEKIYAKARSEMHRKILIQFDIEEENIVIPEEEVGRRVALKTFFDYQTEIIDFSPEYSIMNFRVKNNDLKGKTIQDISKLWSQKHGNRNWNIISITNNHNEVLVATSDKCVFIDYWVSVFCSKKDRRTVYNFFTASKK